MTYELTYIISTEITNEEAQAFSKEIGSFVEQKEGKILNLSAVSAKTLSYPIKKTGSGYYASLEFQAEPGVIKEIRDRVEKDPKVLRSFIIIKKPAKIKKNRRPKPVEQAQVQIQPQAPVEPKPEEQAVKSEKIELEEIDKKLDEILGE